MKSDHFFVFDLHQQLRWILKIKKIRPLSTADDDWILNISDGIKFIDLVNSKPNDSVITTQWFSDGVSHLSDSSNISIWPLIYKVNKLIAKEDEKVFLCGCYIG